MKEFTKYLKNMSRKDITKISQHNNSMWDKLSRELRIKHVEDKKAFYTKKYMDYLKMATTVAQKRICLDMIEYAKRYTS